MQEGLESYIEDEGVYAKLESMDNRRGHEILSILKSRGILRFDEVLLQIYPRVAGGSVKNVFDAIWNYDLVKNRKDLPELMSMIERVASESGGQFGEHHFCDTLQQLTNHIWTINETYGPDIILPLF
jgi:hypothetical protein